jgi:hypothetical protein
VFLLLLLCTDRDVLGPSVNGRKTNMFTAAVVAVLVCLSVILTASVLSLHQLGADRRHHGGLRGSRAARCRVRTGQAAADRPGCGNGDRPRRQGELAHAAAGAAAAPDHVGRPELGMSALRLSLAVAMILVIVKIIDLAVGR